MRSLIQEHGIEQVKIAVTDMDGVLRGKYVSRDKFLSVLDGAIGFCNVVFGWDLHDQLYDDSVRYTGWHTAYPDAQVRVLLDTCRVIPFEPNTLFFLGEFSDGAGQLCPRALLGRVLERARRLGFQALGAFEFEFFLFDETPQSVRAKGYRNIQPITPGYFGYSILRSSVHAEFYHELLQFCRDMDFPIEGLHTETGAGVLEAAIGVDSAMNAADKAVLFKTFAKVLAQRRGWMATFMAKWSSEWPGQSGHIHLSLRDEDGRPVFHDSHAEHGISRTMRHFIGGQQALMPELLAMVACTVNSYSRLVPGFWAPTTATWGIENRTVALRVIGGSPKSQRVEYRIAAADINPYIAMAAAIGSGLWGIEHAIEPTPAIRGNAYDAEMPAHLDLPRGLHDAAGRIKHSEAARSLFGEPFVEHFAATREWEAREHRKAITDWQLARYFEII
ncbi:MAG: glutamine synthetase family protein [Burkholderiaceae bacterium]